MLQRSRLKSNMDQIGIALMYKNLVPCVHVGLKYHIGHLDLRVAVLQLVLRMKENLLFCFNNSLQISTLLGKIFETLQAVSSFWYIFFRLCE
jgi:hypothetical protein